MKLKQRTKYALRAALEAAYFCASLYLFAYATWHERDFLQFASVVLGVLSYFTFFKYLELARLAKKVDKILEEAAEVEKVIKEEREKNETSTTEE